MATEKEIVVNEIVVTEGVAGSGSGKHSMEIMGASLAVPHPNLGATRGFGGRSRAAAAAQNNGQAL